MTKLDQTIAGCLVGIALTTIPIDIAEARRFRAGGGIRSIGAGGQAIAKSYTGNHLTVDQLTTCLGAERKLEKLGADLDGRNQGLTSAQEAIQREKAAIEQAQLRVDRYSQRSIDGFNAMVEKFNARIASNRETVAAYNRDVETQKAQASRFNSDCGGKLYYEDDLGLALTRLGIAAD